MTYGRKPTRGRARPDTGLPQATSESSVRLAWYGDRLRRSLAAMEAALAEAKLGLKTVMPSTGYSQVASLKKIVATLEEAIEAEKADARR